jgi:hypothetical protein
MVNERKTLPIGGGVGASFKTSSSFNFVIDVVSPSLLAWDRPRNFFIFVYSFYINCMIPWLCSPAADQGEDGGCGCRMRRVE